MRNTTCLTSSIVPLRVHASIDAAFATLSTKVDVSAVLLKYLRNWRRSTGVMMCSLLAAGRARRSSQPGPALLQSRDGFVSATRMSIWRRLDRHRDDEAR